MNESMVERVAKAIMRSGCSEDEWDKLDGFWQDVYRNDARAAIEAMREPTEVMTNEWPHAHAHLIEGHWRRAFDAALSEKP